MNQAANVISIDYAKKEDENLPVLSKSGQVYYPNGLPKPVSAWLHAAWASLESLEGFKSRPQQLQLSFQLAAELIRGEKTALISEAPTGTGKTLAYLLAGLAANQATGLPVVVGTATVTLQSQVMDYDLPTLVKGGIVQETDFVLAKGRGRYFCYNSALNQVEHNKELLRAGVQTAFDDVESKEDEIHSQIKDSEELVRLVDKYQWNGEFESLPQSAKYKKVWPLVQCDSATCLKGQCSYINQCGFWKAREAIINAKIVVANHNLILNDLAMVSDAAIKDSNSETEAAAEDAEEKEASFKGVFPIAGKYLAVFDEAHHLPDIAASVGSDELDFESMDLALKKVPVVSDRFLKAPDRAELARKKNLYSNQTSVGVILQKSRFVKSLLQKHFPEEGVFRIKDEHLVKPFGTHTLLAECGELQLELKNVINLFKSMLEICATIYRKTDTGSPNRIASQSFASEIGVLFSEISKAEKALHSLQDMDDERVNWIEHHNGLYKLKGCEMEGRRVLEKLLWNQDRIRGAGFVSATLVGLGGQFDHYVNKIAAPESTKTLKLKAIFNYENSEIHTLKMNYKPGHEKYQQELVGVLVDDINPKEGSLILFNSSRMLKLVYEELYPVYGDILVSQHQLSAQKAVKRHKELIDSGSGSILMGLASMAEGLDLPDKYCTFVGITWLPFGSPADPRQEALEEKYKDQYFTKIVLPEATTKLIQMVGRLLRRENDKGKIMVYDSRLYSSKYGREMRKSLPPFQWVIRNHKRHNFGRFVSVNKGPINQ